jgi:hypothetical protein
LLFVSSDDSLAALWVFTAATSLVLTNLAGSGHADPAREGRVLRNLRARSHDLEAA